MFTFFYQQFLLFYTKMFTFFKPTILFTPILNFRKQFFEKKLVEKMWFKKIGDPKNEVNALQFLLKRYLI